MSAVISDSSFGRMKKVDTGQVADFFYFKGGYSGKLKSFTTFV
ncbi:MAG: hypothetical protein R3243_07745 [Arenibacter latericius]|nr:hypothetical protein [Arenibacter latericius]